MIRFIFLTLVALALTEAARAMPPENFYARKDFQDSAPGSFILQPDAAAFVADLASATVADVEMLLTIVQARPELWKALQNLPSLERRQFQAALQQVHDLEIKLFGIRPRIVFDDTYPRAAFFKFNIADENDPGTIILNLSDPYMVKNPYSALSLLVHETRHAYQLAWARKRGNGAFDRRIAGAFYNAFRAQEVLKGFSFLDFCTLTNEFEAFQFASLFIGRLTGFTVSDPSLGSYASQFHGDGTLKIDLARLHQTWSLTMPDPRKLSEKLYGEFNRREEAQLNELNQK